ncbi:MAG: phenylalanine ammonia-lyase [Conexibacter sp.]|nr:phenylalanine ammonia-lyase [Conexibacter sp.]
MSELDLDPAQAATGPPTTGSAPASPVAEDAVSSVAYVLGLLTDEDVDWLATSGLQRTLAPGEIPVREGDPLPSVMLLLEGAMLASSTIATLPDERRLRGDIIGIVAVIDGGPSPWTVEVLEPSVVLELENAALSTKLELDLGFAARFYRATAVIVAGRRRGTRDADGDRLEPPGALAVNTYLAEDRMRRLLRRVDRRDEIVLTGADLTIEQVARVAWQRAPVAVAPAARERLRQSRAVVDRLVAGERPVYGLNTNLGELKDQRIADEDQATFQRHILLSHAAGVGEEHPTDVVRAIMLARLNGMTRGGAGVQPRVFDAILAMLQAGVHPAVPSRGSIGMSDLPPLAHLALPLIGEGEVELDGVRMTGAEGLAAAGIEPPQLAAKDGLALVSANSASVGHAALVIARAIDLLAIADVAAALSLEGLAGHASALDRHIDAARRFSGQMTSAQQMRMLLEGSSLWFSRPALGVQDPISFRSASQVHGSVLDVVELVRSTLETELNSTGDNPMVLIDSGEIISDGNFHPAGLSIALDTLGIALAQLTSMAANRIVRLMDPGFTHLATYLTARPGLNVGLGVLQKTATALNAEVRLAANPASLDYVPVAGAIEDHATMAVEGAAKAARAIDAAFGLFAIELLVAAQAIDLREGITLGAGTAAAYAHVRERAPRMGDDRLMSRDIAAVRGALDDGSLLRVVGTAISRPLGIGIEPLVATAAV